MGLRRYERLRSILAGPRETWQTGNLAEEVRTGTQTARCTEAYADATVLYVPELPSVCLEAVQGRFPEIVHLKFSDAVSGRVRMRLADPRHFNRRGMSGAEYRDYVTNPKRRLLGVKHAFWLEPGHDGDFRRLERLPEGMRIHFPAVPLVDGRGEWFVPVLAFEAGALGVSLRQVVLGIGPLDRIAVFGRSPTIWK